MKGAGGTEGGLRDFFVGLSMMAIGFYMLLSKIVVSSSFGMGHRLYHVKTAGMNFGLTTGMVFIPMIIGIGMIFYNAKSIWGWFISGISVAAMIFGVISSTTIRLQTMSSFDLIVILVLAFGGVGLFLRSLKKAEKLESKNQETKSKP